MLEQNEKAQHDTFAIILGMLDRSFDDKKFLTNEDMGNEWIIATVRVLHNLKSQLIHPMAEYDLLLAAEQEGLDPTAPEHYACIVKAEHLLYSEINF